MGDINLDDYTESEEERREETDNSNNEKKRAKENPEKTGDPVVSNNELSALAKRLGGFGMTGKARQAFEQEFGSLARIINNIFDIEEASKIISLNTSMRPEYRLIGGVFAMVFASASWRFVINKDMEKGGEIRPTVTEQDTKKPEDKKRGSNESEDKPDKDNVEEDTGSSNFTFQDKRVEREKEKSTSPGGEE